ncbi:MAG: LytTR family DNA-binding domain-containing protein [Cyclobacteriaceae bacterium]
MKIRCLVVDDEPLAINVIKSFVERLDQLELVNTCANAIEAFNLLSNEQIDLLFIDIQMPQMTGLEFLKALKSPPKVIITTAYREYAMEGYELDVVDYLLKPISFDRFLKAINKVTDQAPNAESNARLVVSSAEEDPYIFVREDKKMRKIVVKEIQYIESIKDYVKIITDGHVFTTYLQISYLEKKLPEESFVRVHRSFIVGICHIKAYSSTDIEIGDQSIPIGRHYKNHVMSLLDKLNTI